MSHRLKLIVGEDKLYLVSGVDKEILLDGLFLIILIEALDIHSLDLDLALVPQVSLSCGHVVPQVHFWHKVFALNLWVHRVSRLAVANFD